MAKFFSLPQKKCHAGRFVDSYRRHSAFDSSESSFFEIDTRARKCLDANDHVGACRINPGIIFSAVGLDSGVVWYFLGEHRHQSCLFSPFHSMIFKNIN